MDHAEATPREHWHAGSALEIYSNTERRWSIGWVLAEDASQNLSVIFYDESSFLKYKPIGRRDPNLASVGTNIRRLPDHFEVAADGTMAHRSGRRCRTLKDAWAVHFEMNIRPQVQHLNPWPEQWHNNGAALRGHLQGTVQHQQPQLSAQPQPVATQTVSPLGAEMTGVTASMAAGSFCSQVLPASSPPAHEQIARLQQSLEENERFRAEDACLQQELREQVEEQARQIERLQIELANSKIHLEEAQKEREQARGQLEKARHELTKLGGDTSLLGDSPCQADEAAPPGEKRGRDRSADLSSPSGKGSMVLGTHRQSVGSARERRRSADREMVEVNVVVPRARNPEEVAADGHQLQREETQRRNIQAARSAQSLPQVVRMPSAPVQPASAQAQAHRIAQLATPRASVVHVVAQQQPPQPGQARVQQPGQAGVAPGATLQAVPQPAGGYTTARYINQVVPVAAFRPQR